MVDVENSSSSTTKASSSKIGIPLFVVVLFVVFLIAEALIVGLIPLTNKNRSLPCESDAGLVKQHNPESNSNIIPLRINPNSQKFKNLQQNQTNKFQALPHLSKTNRPNLKQRLRNFYSKNPNYFRQKSIFTRRNMTKGILYDDCPELLNPVAGEQYPWFKSRLPDYVRPTRYDIELFVPEWNNEAYDGFNSITFNVLQPTSYVILNTKTEINVLFSITDKDDNILDIACDGEFSYYDYYIVKLKNQIQPSQSPLKITFFVLTILPEFDTGIFEFDFGLNKESTMLVSKFSPISARNAFPCFDEPGFKAQFNFQVDHQNDTIALFNTPESGREESPEGLEGYIRTSFVQTEPMPFYLIGVTVFTINDFGFVQDFTLNKIPVKLWAQKRYIEGGYANDPLSYVVALFNTFLDFFPQVDPKSLPAKIDIMAVPEYPVDSVSHFGLLMYKEDKILFTEKTASERDKQTIALQIAKSLGEFWFGNFVTMSWWNELWLQEGFSDYLKYKIVDETFPTWNIYQQFITEELLSALVDDAYPSSHPIEKNINNPYEIEEFFDEVENAKVAAILRIVEEEKNEFEMINALTAYLNAHPWGTGEIDVLYQKIGNINKWTSKDFFQRWTRQANYPTLKISLIDNSNTGINQSIRVVQSRTLNTNNPIFGIDQLYPSEFDFTWFIPLTCSFGTGPTNNDQFTEINFYIDTKEFTAPLRNSFNKKYTWVHCDRKFNGYFLTQYSDENWEQLGQGMRNKNNELLAEDRANIIHNLFLNAYTNNTSYFVVRDVLSYLSGESDYLPWRTVYKHVNDLLDVLDYKKSFLEVSQFFIAEMRDIELGTEIWKPTGIHIEELLRETIIELACRLQDSICLNNVTELWEVAVPALLNDNFNTSLLPPFVREVVFKYHIQNTYNLNDWKFIFLDYETTNDFIEQRNYLEALTFSRLPWLLSKYLEALKDDGLRNVEFFEALKWLSKNTLGRDIVWNYVRSSYDEILNEFGLDDPKLGQMLLDIVVSFQNEFLYAQLLSFLQKIPSGATDYARIQALELVQINYDWVNNKENEVIQAFGSPRNQPVKQTIPRQGDASLELKAEQVYTKLRNDLKIKKSLKF